MNGWCGNQQVKAEKRLLFQFGDRVTRLYRWGIKYGLL